MKMLKTARKQMGLTMKELGALVGVSESAISQYENGRREADFKTLLKISEALHCSVDYLLRGNEAGTQEPQSPDGGEPADEAYQQIKKFILSANQDELEQTLRYIAFLKSQRK